MKLPPLFRNLLRTSHLVRYFYFNLHFADIPVFLGSQSFRQNAHSAMRLFLNEKELQDDNTIKTLYKDIKSCFYRYKTTPLEYFLFDFRSKSAAERESYISDSMIMMSAANRSGRRIHDIELNNKFNFYRINRQFFNREVFLFDAKVQKRKFIDFALNVRRVIAKPNNAALGAGVELFSIDTSAGAETVFNHLKSKGIDYVVEELIVQNDKMASWNQTSVNTVRVNSFLSNGHFNILAPFIRMGRKGSIVDNGGQGGIFASIDKEQGRITTDGMDERGNVFSKHPDSDITFRNWQVPQWHQLLELTETMHRNMPKHVYISWDFALTDNGWVVIEGNWGEFVCQQITNKRGFKKEFLDCLNAK